MLGKNSVIIPLIKVQNIDIQVMDDNYDVVILTSQNAVHAVEKSSWIKRKPIFVVGNKTKEKLLQIGCGCVMSSNGTARNLEETIVNNVSNTLRILYLSGDYTSYDLDIKLKSRGYDVTKKTAYRANAVQSLSKQEIGVMNTSDTILFYSPRTASVFTKLAWQYSLRGNDKVAICISNNCASLISELVWKEIRIANRPNEKAMFALL
ncbi:uroporphyrinogen-III synthase [Candidatus Bandiella euplotis]|nr:uroporphyrinogen-III synthase [Candidatus Bandiella woodruffii]